MSDETGTAPDVVLLCTDLMFDSRICGAAQQAGLTIESVAGVAAAVELAARGGCRVVVADLTVPGLSMETLVSQLNEECVGGRPEVIAFGPHVQTGRLEAAREAGCDQVLTRGQFDARLKELLQSVAG